jgi:hypothetical protein
MVLSLARSSVANLYGSLASDTKETSKKAIFAV